MIENSLEKIKITLIVEWVLYTLPIGGWCLQATELPPAPNYHLQLIMISYQGEHKTGM